MQRQVDVDAPGEEGWGRQDVAGRPAASYICFIHGYIALGLIYADKVYLYNFVQNLCVYHKKRMHLHYTN
jgi:hypothetical protein